MIVDAVMEVEQLDFSVKIYTTQITVFVESYGFSFQLQSVKSIRDANEGFCI